MKIEQGKYLTIVLEAMEDTDASGVPDSVRSLEVRDFKLRLAYKANRKIHSDRVAVIAEPGGSVGSGQYGRVLAVVDERMLAVALQEFAGREIVISTHQINRLPGDEE